jgi:hypothetical protein
MSVTPGEEFGYGAIVMEPKMLIYGEHASRWMTADAG